MGNNTKTSMGLAALVRGSSGEQNCHEKPSALAFPTKGVEARENQRGQQVTR